jgi:aryl-alcohol dehydrogenase-like predicted oxidoreductase
MREPKVTVARLPDPGNWIRGALRISAPNATAEVNSMRITTSRLGLGLAAIGRPGYINLGHASDLGGRTDEESMRSGAHAMLDSAYALGIRYFDAARSYGMAEAFLAGWLQRRGLQPPEIAVGSKWGYTYTADWEVRALIHEVKDLSVGSFRRQLAESREILGSNLGLYQIHSATLESGVLDDRAVLEDLAHLRASGVSIGLSVTGPKQADTVERALEVGGFDAVQATWNLLERSAGTALAAAHSAGLVVIVKESLANGRLTSRGPLSGLTQAARNIDSTPDALALAAVLAQPWADVVLSGATTVSELTSNISALALNPEPELLEQLESLREDPPAYWETRAALPWN